MSRQSLLDFLSHKTDTYEHLDKPTLSNGALEIQPLFNPVCERPIFNSGYDVFGVHWTRAFPASHYTTGQEPIIKDIEDWRNELRIPCLDRFDWEYVRAQEPDRENKVIQATLIVGPFERTTTLSTFEDCLMNAISEPEEFSALIGALTDYKIDIVRRVYEAGRPDMFNLHDDWGTSLSTFLSPALWREVVKPHVKRLYDAVHELGALVGQHSCGCLETIVGDMVELGCDVWEAQEDVNDITLLRAQFGDKLCIVCPPSLSADDPGLISLDQPEPDPSAFPMSFRPYQEKPEHLYA